YRFFEILPGAISIFAIALLFVLSFIDPIFGAIYLFFVISTTLVKAVSVAYRTVQGYNVMKRAESVNWRKRIEDLENPHEAFERLRDKDLKEYDFEQHVSNLRMMAAMSEGYPAPAKIYHAVIMTAYNEGLETLKPSIEAVKNTSFPNEKIIFMFAYEERGGEEMEENANKLREQYKGVFHDFILSKHPADLSNEVVGKGPNLTYAGAKLAEYVEKKHI
ncbi:hypothetical protein ACQUWZ_26800, partial [Ralstonia pseudosolanacearum]|uniref:hypothetical protein n=1 Tax=Ralstonia pseudosolanacearum TaxID=1310165 RepID=UPI003D17B10A